jgi:hypothetical protein
MPILYRIFPDQKVAYIKAWGKTTIDEIMIEGARMFAETEWENGFNILCDYREITEVNPTYQDIEKIVDQDKRNEPLFDNSKCAVVAKNDLIFGLSRMWEILSENTNLKKMVFKDINEARSWLGLEVDFLDGMLKLP